MEEKKETIIKINWGSGNMVFIAEKFFPITAEKMTKLYKKCIRYDWEHQDEIVKQIFEALNWKEQDLKKTLEFQITRKADIEQELALLRGRSLEKDQVKNKLANIKEQVRLTNQELKQVQKNIELLTMLSTPKK